MKIPVKQTTMVNWARLLRNLMEARNIKTQANYAVFLGVPAKTLYDWTSGRRTPRMASRKMICDKHNLGSHLTKELCKN